MTVNLDSSLVISLMLIKGVYGDQYKIQDNLKNLRNQLLYTVILSIHVFSSTHNKGLVESL